VFIQDKNIILELSEEEREELFKHAVLKDYSKGSIISSPGDKPSYLFYVLQGLVKSYDLSASGPRDHLPFVRTQGLVRNCPNFQPP
jgi:CRP-like cAMP-binding protein